MSTSSGPNAGPDASPRGSDAPARDTRRLRERVGADLGQRVASGLVMAALAVGLTAAGILPFAFLLAVVGAVVAWEWGRLVRGTAVDAAMAVHIATVVAGIVLTGLGLAVPALVAVLIGFILTGLLCFGRHAALSAIGVVFAALPGMGLLWLRGDEPHGLKAVFFVLVAVVATDVGAYFAGRLIGGPKLWPRVSPNKTWSGLAGGVSLAALVGLGFAAMTQGATGWHLMLSGAGLALAAQAGDLAESALKRRFDAKDASNLIPGHGGFMDRVDGLATAAIVAASSAAWMNMLAPARALLTW